MDRLMLLKKIKDEIIEERNAAQEKAQEDAKKSTPRIPTSMPSPSSLYSSSSLQSLASRYGVSLPH